MRYKTHTIIKYFCNFFRKKSIFKVFHICSTFLGTWENQKYMKICNCYFYLVGLKMKHKTLKLLKKSLNYQTFLYHFPKKELSHKLTIYAE